MPKKNGNITRKKACSILSDVIDNHLTFDVANKIVINKIK